jgi:hypothetical protein
MFYLSIEGKGRGAKEYSIFFFIILESFYKLKDFMNQYDPENLSSLLAFEDILYLVMEKRKNRAKITDFFKKQLYINA